MASSTPERVWQALTDPAFTERYWRAALDSDWIPGSTITLRQWGLTIADPDQVVLESKPLPAEHRSRCSGAGAALAPGALVARVPPSGVTCS
jgi:hypothetical protein